MVNVSRRSALLAAVSGAAAAGLAACTKKSVAGPASPSPTPTPSPTTSPTPSVTPPPPDNRPRWPLTGVLLKHKPDARHAAVAVKVPDTEGEHPQVGIDKADIVFVELDGYLDGSGHSSTRLLPLFHSRMPEDVGPVRSIRPVDIPLLCPTHAIIGNTGAAGWVLNYAKRYRKYVEGMLSYMETLGTGSYSIDQSRVRQINGVTYYDRAVVCHPKTLAKQTKKFRDGPPRVYFPFATGDDKPSTAGGKRAQSIEVPYKGDTYAMGYTYDKASKRYLRSMPWGPHVLKDGTRVSTDNVLVIRAKQRFDKIYRGGGHDEPIHEIVESKGTFFYFHQGRYVTGSWTKGKVWAPFKLTLDNGEPLIMAPGQTFVELPNLKAKVRIG